MLFFLIVYRAVLDSDIFGETAQFSYEIGINSISLLLVKQEQRLNWSTQRKAEAYIVPRLKNQVTRFDLAFMYGCTKWTVSNSICMSELPADLSQILG